MRNKIIPIVVALLTLSVIAVVVLGATKSGLVGIAPLVPLQPGTKPIDPNAGLRVSTSIISTSTPAGVKAYTFAEISKHSATSTCWMALDGTVYDVTSWYPEYQGGREAGLALCGKDATGAFLRQYGALVEPQRELAPFDIGIVIR